MENKQILCEGCGKNKPTLPKTSNSIPDGIENNKPTSPKKEFTGGAERSKPTVSKDQVQKPTGKK